MPRFLDVLVDPHPALPDGCCMRWKLAGEPRPVTRVRWEPDDAPAGVFRVHGLSDREAVIPALAVLVEDSSAGTSLLVYGGAHGLRLVGEEDGAAVAELYLLVAPDEVLEATDAGVA